MRPYCDIGNMAESTCNAYGLYCDWKPTDGTSTTPENNSALASAAYECVPKAGSEEMRPYCDIGNAAERTCNAYGLYCDWKPTDGTSTTPENNCVPKPGFEGYTAYCILGNMAESTCHAYGLYCDWKPSEGTSTTPENNSALASAAYEC